MAKNEQTDRQTLLAMREVALLSAGCFDAAADLQGQCKSKAKNVFSATKKGRIVFEYIYFFFTFKLI